MRFFIVLFITLHKECRYLLFLLWSMSGGKCTLKSRRSGKSAAKILKKKLMRKVHNRAFDRQILHLISIVRKIRLRRYLGR